MTFDLKHILGTRGFAIPRRDAPEVCKNFSPLK